jgi:hypothetical protein
MSTANRQTVSASKPVTEAAEMPPDTQRARPGFGRYLSTMTPRIWTLAALGPGGWAARGLTSPTSG